MSKIIYLKDGGSIKVSNYEKLVFEKDWVHIKGEYRINRYIINKSIPSSNIKFIQEE